MPSDLSWWQILLGKAAWLAGVWLLSRVFPTGRKGRSMWKGIKAISQR